MRVISRSNFWLILRCFTGSFAYFSRSAAFPIILMATRCPVSICVPNLTRPFIFFIFYFILFYYYFFLINFVLNFTFILNRSSKYFINFSALILLGLLALGSSDWTTKSRLNSYIDLLRSAYLKSISSNSAY